MDVILKIILSLAQRFLDSIVVIVVVLVIVMSIGVLGVAGYISFTWSLFVCISLYPTLAYNISTLTSDRFYSCIIRHNKSCDQISNKAF